MDTDSQPSPSLSAPSRRPAARLAAAGLMALTRALTGVRSFWTGCTPEPRQRVYFANHTSHTDFLLLWASLPPALRATTRPVAGADYWLRSPLRRFIIQDVFNGVLVQRSQPSGDDHDARVQAAALALQPLHEALAQGHSLIIFPEGTRNPGDELLPFKSGIHHLARAWPQVEFVPVWLENLHRVMPKGHVIPLPLLCTVTFGAPVPLHVPSDATTAHAPRIHDSHPGGGDGTTFPAESIGAAQPDGNGSASFIDIDAGQTVIDSKALHLQRCRDALQALKPVRD